MTDDSAVWQYVRGKGADKVIVDWVSDSTGGTVSQESTFPISGVIDRIVTVPDATTPPDADYDVTLLDEDGLDVALTLLGNRSASAAETVYPAATGTNGGYWQMAVSGRLTLTITNAGNSTKGKLTIYLR